MTGRIACREEAGTGRALLLILATAALRFAFAATLGLGVDESYMIAAGRAPRFGYFDHPPAAWWLSWAATRLFGSDSALAVRLPFIALFALSTWLMFCIGRRLYGARAGLWAAAAFNLSPVFGVTTGSWVLPDGPLDCALLGAFLCLLTALGARTAGAAWVAWLAAGLWAGVALFSKYSAVLPLAGAAAYLLTQPTDRHWLRRPHPYAAAALIAVLVAPVLLWNAAHGWQSFAFQAGRASGLRFRPLGPANVLGGEALFLLPWIWLPLAVIFVRGLRAGPADRWLWLQVCLGTGLIAAFPLIALWSGQRVLFHWGAPGWMMLFPAFGAWLAARVAAAGKGLRWAAVATAILVPAAALGAASDARWGWIPEGMEDAVLSQEPEIESVSWRGLAAELGRRGLFDPMLSLAGMRWNECGKLDYAFGRDRAVLCLGNDAHEYAMSGRDRLPPHGAALVVTSRQSDFAWLLADPCIAHVTRLAPIRLVYRGETMKVLSLFLVAGATPAGPSGSQHCASRMAAGPAPGGIAER